MDSIAEIESGDGEAQCYSFPSMDLEGAIGGRSVVLVHCRDSVSLEVVRKSHAASGESSRDMSVAKIIPIPPSQAQMLFLATMLSATSSAYSERIEQNSARIAQLNQEIQKEAWAIGACGGVGAECLIKGAPIAAIVSGFECGRHLIEHTKKGFERDVLRYENKLMKQGMSPDTPANPPELTQEFHRENFYERDDICPWTYDDMGRRDVSGCWSRSD